MTENYITFKDNSLYKILQELSNAFSERRNVAYFMIIKYDLVAFCIFLFQ